MSNVRMNAEVIARLEEQLVRAKKAKENAETSQKRTNAEARIKRIQQELRDVASGSGQPSKYAMGGAVKKKFTPCAHCPDPAGCSAKGKCAKKGYAKGGAVKKYAQGGYVNCGASTKPSQKGTPK